MEIEMDMDTKPLPEHRVRLGNKVVENLNTYVKGLALAYLRGELNISDYLMEVRGANKLVSVFQDWMR